MAAAVPIAIAEGDALVAAAVRRLPPRDEQTAAFGIAVSGGADSLALLHLVAGWATRSRVPKPRLHILTVDHGLRPGSAGEAQAVAVRARALGLEHATLRWIGDKPKTAIQAQARDARYQLIGDFAREHGLDAVFIAHTADDQAETVLMRLAHGSGLDGLAGMQALSRRDDLVLLRPLLSVAKVRLLATLQAAGTTWIEDPSNQQRVFERIRVRAAAPLLGDLGLTAASIGRTARRLERASAALIAATEALLADQTFFQGFELGYCRFPLARWQSLPDEIRVRTLGRLLVMIGGQSGPVSMLQVEDLVARLCRPGPRGATLGRCALSVSAGAITIVREEGRSALPTLTVLPGIASVWDNRFAIGLLPTATGTAEVRALGADGLADVTTGGLRRPGLPAAALRTLPSFWRQGRLVAVPSLAAIMPYGGPAEAAIKALCGDARATFLGLRGVANASQ